MENKDQFLTSVTSILQQVVSYANGENPEQRNFFQEMENDPNFQKSFKDFENQQKKQGASDMEVVQAQLINLMVEDDIYRQGMGDYRYFDEDLLRSSEILRQAGRSSICSLIKTYRATQLQLFGQLASKDQPGITLKHKDPEFKPKDSEIAEMKKWSDIFANKFFFMMGEDNANLGKVLGASYNDFFDLDKICFYIHRANNGQPLGMIMVDAAMVKTIVPKRYSIQRWDQEEFEELVESTHLEKPYSDDFRYILVNKHKTRVAKFTKKSMVMSNLFKTSSIDFLYKGNSIVEQSVKEIASAINSIDFNSARFTNNRMPQGIIGLNGAANVSPIVVEKFKKLLWAQSMGPSNAWRIPIISLPDKSGIQWIPFNQSSKDMEYFNWFSLLATMLCVKAQIQPEVLGLASNRGTMEGKGALFQQSPENAQMRSKDEGLRTFLNYETEIFNDTGIVYELTGKKDWLLSFSGLDVKDETAQEELNVKRLTTHSTVNEILGGEGKKSYTLELGGMNVFDIPAIGNQNVYQLVVTAIQQKQQEEMEKKQAAMGGMPGAEGQPQPGQEGQPEGEPGQGEEVPEFSEQDLKLLQEYGIGTEEDREAVKKAMPYITKMLKSQKAKPKQPEVIQLIIED